MKKQWIAVMIILLAVTWGSMISEVAGRPGAYARALENAERNDEKGMYEEAIKNYEEALAYQPGNTALRYAIARDYRELGNRRTFENYCKSALNESDAYEDVFHLLMEHYKEREDYDDALSFLHEMMDKYPENGYIAEAYEGIKGAYDEGYNTFQNIGDFYAGHASVQNAEGIWGSVSYKDEVVTLMRYEWSGPYVAAVNGGAVRKEDGNCVYVDKKGNTILATDQPVSWLGIMVSGRMLIQEKQSGRYRYVNDSLEGIGEMDYEDATSIVERVGAVKQNGKWAVVNSSLKEVTDYQYDHVIMDGNKVATRNRVLWVRTGDKYKLINHKGEDLTEAVYEDARPFASDEPAAAKKGDKWGFVDVKGNEVTPFAYEEAKSFCAGFAPVREGNYWKYIDVSGRECIDGLFTDAGVFDERGVAFVQREGSSWFLIDLIDK